MKKRYDAELALNPVETEEIGLTIDFEKMAEAYMKSLTELEYNSWKLGIESPIAFKKFMSQLGLSIAQRLIRDDIRFAGKSDMEVLSGFTDEFCTSIESSLRFEIKALADEFNNKSN
jgi:hypothetical protein